MSLTDAFTQLATWTITGVTVHSFLSEPEYINAVDLPALIPEIAPGYEGMKPFDIGLNTGEMNVFVNLHILLSPVAGSLATERNTALLTVIENFLAAVVADWTLDDNLTYPMSIENMRYGAYERRGIPYTALTFLTKWTLTI